ncbi:MAG: FHA domain-containing protein [Leucobacter sp.]
MSELTLLVLRLGFLLLLWLFIFAIVYALRSDLFGAPVRRLQAEGEAKRQASGASGAPAPPATPAAPPAPAITPSGGALPSARGSAPARTLVITSGVAAGTSLPLDDDFVTIGRSSDSTLVIVDEFTSTYHARLARAGEQWMLTDLDSTNGTRLNGTRITGTVPVPIDTPITIGTTTFELRP